MAKHAFSRSYALPMIVLAGAAAFVLASVLLTWPASAARSSEPELRQLTLSADQVKYLVIHEKPAAVVAAWEVSGPDLDLVASAASPILSPDYAESLKTDALNFVETRLRC